VADILVYLWNLRSAGKVREEWGIKSAGMVETYMCIPDACLP
jgi:hypothetical protein